MVCQKLASELKHYSCYYIYLPYPATRTSGNKDRGINTIQNNIIVILAILNWVLSFIPTNISSHAADLNKASDINAAPIKIKINLK